jgi:uncharacterized protein YndB with AHSA1/START domain
MPNPLIITTPTDREIVVVRDFDAPRDLVWECWIRPELLRRWFGPPEWELVHCEFEPRVGGKWRFVTRGPDGMEMASGGTIREFVRPERMVTTEKYDIDWTGGETLISNVFTEKDGRTTSTMTVLYASKEARDGARATPMAEGMELGFKRLDELLASTLAK